ncbi:hypothetical protein Raf01_03590 [Rugosimonospora africana]|uniref:Uncharacterized protein n=1 Tax=Rugosimonospora africana TaxID=556532 RepID=A0A8J3QMC2_9ACTN|nr:hypothetical protein Raf01_03590 [Rugosimonospora africana]
MPYRSRVANSAITPRSVPKPWGWLVHVLKTARARFPGGFSGVSAPLNRGDMLADRTDWDILAAPRLV